MTIKEMAGLIGQRGTIVTDGWVVTVVIDDVRQRGWGHTDYKVRQLGYDSARWVSSNSVDLD
jgi:hypothetical protein